MDTRKLIVERQKSFVASIMKINLYIQDGLSNEATAYGLRFRKLGEIKNDTEISFEIECGEIVLFSSVDDTLAKVIKSGYELPVEVSRVIMDKMVIPAGREDIVISGENKFNLLKGNSFIFNKNMVYLF